MAPSTNLAGVGSSRSVGREVPARLVPACSPVLPNPSSRLRSVGSLGADGGGWLQLDALLETAAASPQLRTPAAGAVVAGSGVWPTGGRADLAASTPPLPLPIRTGAPFCLLDQCPRGIRSRVGYRRSLPYGPHPSVARQRSSSGHRNGPGTHGRLRCLCLFDAGQSLRLGTASMDVGIAFETAPRDPRMVAAGVVE